MSIGETVIAFLLGVIAWLLYQIAKQLSYLTGKRIRFRLLPLRPKNLLKQPPGRGEEKLPN